MFSEDSRMDVSKSSLCFWSLACFMASKRTSTRVSTKSRYKGEPKKFTLCFKSPKAKPSVDGAVGASKSLAKKPKIRPGPTKDPKRTIVWGTSC